MFAYAIQVSGASITRSPTRLEKLVHSWIDGHPRHVHAKNYPSKAAFCFLMLQNVGGFTTATQFLFWKSSSISAQKSEYQKACVHHVVTANQRAPPKKYFSRHGSSFSKVSVLWENIQRASIWKDKSCIFGSIGFPLVSETYLCKAVRIKGLVIKIETRSTLCRRVDCAIVFSLISNANRRTQCE